MGKVRGNLFGNFDYGTTRTIISYNTGYVRNKIVTSSTTLGQGKSSFMVDVVVWSLGCVPLFFFLSLRRVVRVHFSSTAGDSPCSLYPPPTTAVTKLGQDAVRQEAEANVGSSNLFKPDTASNQA